MLPKVAILLREGPSVPRIACKMKRRAFTLGEILIAIAVAAVAILVLASLAATVWKAAKYAKYTAYASNLARQQMERLRGDPSYFTSTMNGPATGRAYASDFDVDDGQPVRFQGELIFTLLPAPQDRYVNIVSRVTWTQENKHREAVLETILPVP